MRIKRIIAAAAAAVLLAVTLLCVSFTAVSAVHHCCGENCPVCANLDKANSTVKQLAVSGNASAPVITPVCAPAGYICILSESIRTDSTPITLKTRKDE